MYRLSLLLSQANSSLAFKVTGTNVESTNRIVLPFENGLQWTYVSIYVSISNIIMSKQIFCNSQIDAKKL